MSLNRREALCGAAATLVAASLPAIDTLASARAYPWAGIIRGQWHTGTAHEAVEHLSDWLDLDLDVERIYVELSPGFVLYRNQFDSDWAFLQPSGHGQTIAGLCHASTH